MRIVHIGHGRLPIPPTHWGAVEAIIEDYCFWSEKFGHEMRVINERRPEDALLKSLAFQPDVVHIHDETKLPIFAAAPSAEDPILVVTTHDPTFFDKPNPFIPRFVRGNFLIGCLSDEQRREFAARGAASDRLLMVPNGARADLIRFNPQPAYPDRMICLGMIGQRKRQNLLFPMDFVDCVGPVSAYDPVEIPPDIAFPSWSKQQVYDNLTDYSALVLISKSEADPLVVKEALMAGLTVFVSEAAAANLDRSQPFVHVLDEATINTPFALALRLRTEPIHDRQKVRSYAEQHFDWPILAKQYLSSLWKILRQKHQQTVDTV